MVLRKKSLLSMLLLTSLAGSIFVASDFETKANASKPTYVKSFPKSIQGTWYTYIGFDGSKKKLYTLHLNASATKFHPYNAKLQKEVSKTGAWSYATVFKYNGNTWYNFRGWQQSAGDGSFYSVKTIGGHRVLTEAEGATISVIAHYYQTKSLAKKIGPKKYSGFDYQSGY